MTSSDTIALLALVVALISFWLSYRNARESRLLVVAEKFSRARLQMLQMLLKIEDMALFVKAAAARDDRDPTQRTRRQLFVEELETMRVRAQQLSDNLSSASEFDPLIVEKNLRTVSDLTALFSSLEERFEKVKAAGFVLAEPPARKTADWPVSSN